MNDTKKPPTLHWFYAVGPNCWGTGTTLEKACKNAAANWPRGHSGVKRPNTKHFSVWEIKGITPEECSISDFDARLTWKAKPGMNPTAVKVQTSSVAVKD